MAFGAPLVSDADYQHKGVNFFTLLSEFWPALSEDDQTIWRDLTTPESFSNRGNFVSYVLTLRQQIGRLQDLKTVEEANLWMTARKSAPIPKHYQPSTGVGTSAPARVELERVGTTTPSPVVSSDVVSASTLAPVSMDPVGTSHKSYEDQQFLPMSPNVMNTHTSQISKKSVRACKRRPKSNTGPSSDSTSTTSFWLRFAAVYLIILLCLYFLLAYYGISNGLLFFLLALVLVIVIYFVTNRQIGSFMPSFD
jgi:hypothetical protein